MPILSHSLVIDFNLSDVSNFFFSCLKGEPRGNLSQKHYDSAILGTQTSRIPENSKKQSLGIIKTHELWKLSIECFLYEWNIVDYWSNFHLT